MAVWGDKADDLLKADCFALLAHAACIALNSPETLAHLGCQNARIMIKGHNIVAGIMPIWGFGTQGGVRDAQ